MNEIHAQLFRRTLETYYLDLFAHDPEYAYSAAHTSDPDGPYLTHLRTLARYIGECTDRAYAAWRADGRKRDTIRPWQDASRVLADGRRSYY